MYGKEIKSLEINLRIGLELLKFLEIGRSKFERVSGEVFIVLDIVNSL